MRFGWFTHKEQRKVVRIITAEGLYLPASELARELPITRQAVAKHLAVLDGAGLVGVTREGREVRYRLRAETLEEAAGWLASVGGEWDARLERLRRLA